MGEGGALTTVSAAPPATAPSMAAFTSASSSARPAAASGPSPTHCCQSTTPAVPSMSVDRKTFTMLLLRYRRGPPARAADALLPVDDARCALDVGGQEDLHDAAPSLSAGTRGDGTLTLKAK